MSKIQGKRAWMVPVEAAQAKTDFQNNLLFKPTKKTNKLIPQLIKDNGQNLTSKKKDPFEAKKSSTKISLKSLFLKYWADEESNLRLSWTTLAIIAFSFVAAGIFYAIEKNSQCEWTYWRCLWLVNTIYTTIGYGSLHPCTTGGRIAAVIFAFIGIPLNVFALADVGRLLARFLAMIWSKLFKRFFRYIKTQFICFDASKVTVVVENNDPIVNHNPHNHLSSSDIPLWFALAVTFLWLLASALFFTLTEPDTMSFADSLYFIMISITTIGFGDVVPEKYNLVVFQFFFVIIGISLFSMVISIVQEKIYSLSDNVEGLIGREYAAAQIEGSALPSDEQGAREHIKRIIRKQKGGIGLRLVMSKHMEDRLVQDYMQKSRKHLAQTQTDNNVEDKEIMVAPTVRNARVQAMFATTSSHIAVDEGTQVMWMPKGWDSLSWLDLSRAAGRHKKFREQEQKQQFQINQLSSITTTTTTKSSASKPGIQQSKKPSITPSGVTSEKYDKILKWLNS